MCMARNYEKGSVATKKKQKKMKIRTFILVICKRKNTTGSCLP